MDNQQLLMRDLKKFIGFRKGVIEILNFDVEEYEKPNIKTVEATCKCHICNAIFKIKLTKLLKPASYYEHNCPNCKEAYRIKCINERFKDTVKGVFKFIEFDHFEGKRAFIKCRCLRCGKDIVVREDRMTKSQNPKSCKYCYPSLNSKITKLRYYKLHEKTGEEYEHDKQIRAKISTIKQGAKSRNLLYNLSEEHARNLLEGECYYCKHPFANGIDRIDSLKGYTQDNCVSCCKYCNIMKNNLEVDFFLSKVQEIFYNRISNSTTIENTEKSGSE